MARIGRDYFPNNAGMRELGNSAAIQGAALDAAANVAAAAGRIDTRGDYSYRPTDVTVGYNNDRRAGAMVEEIERAGGGRKRALRRAAGGA